MGATSYSSPSNESEPTFGLYRLDAQKSSIDEIVRKLTYNGGVIVENLISQEILREVEQELRPYFSKEWDTDAMFSKKTRVVTSVPRKSKAFVEKLFGNPTYIKVCDALLTSSHEVYFGDTVYNFTSPPIYNASTAFSTLPGNVPQRLHRDDLDHHHKRPAITPEQYDIERDSTINMFVAGTRATKENGATRFIPGSHLQDTLHKPEESQAVHVELQPGDAFFMLGSTYHAASKNVTESEERIMYSMFTIRSFLRQTENLYLSLSLDRLREFSPFIQKRLGFSSGSPLSGHIDLKDIRKVLDLPGPSDVQWFYD
ncbi:phytanoyl-CoA dioxygenase family protein [Penicillium taxi]|uniref:phytanoyl-CoA dioxygenase family protein n=1 Tax=Penicillium taxi TaxID=168475 RepID=UPI002544FD94|nr:phytanoyl-CoA dioxygenase family protein [Penicillium taxi]KAJ5895361.1 phytanoyl-CoA dioxygenase family protein [Penicillium taxi]